VSFSFGQHVAYSVPTLSLTGAAQQVQVNFDEGEHVFTSSDFELGTIHALKDAPLIGRLVFRYTYTVEGGVNCITVCDEDYESADGMTLMTFPKDREDASCFERASSAGFAADEIYRNGYWNTRSPLMPGASQIFKDLTRDASRALVTALKAQSITVTVRSTLPELPLEMYEKLCFVVQDGKFVCSYDELHQRKIEGQIQVWDIRSSFGGTTTFAPGTQFANPLQCSSLGYPGGFPCTPGMAGQVGGHIILGTTAFRPLPGAKNVLIIPICKRHNNVNYTGDMIPVVENRAVKLLNYLQ
ncbi:hypothetical protein BKA62DRAFT_711638, partial [Auriculariales sp. MPI-PUGE-AT-0066]